MKMIVAVLNARPGMRPQLIELLRAHRARTLTEPGCQLFEVLPLDDTPEGVHLAEVYASAEAHRMHDQMDYMQRFLAELPRYCARFRGNALVSDDVEVMAADFS